MTERYPTEPSLPVDCSNPYDRRSYFDKKFGDQGRSFYDDLITAEDFWQLMYGASSSFAGEIHDRYVQLAQDLNKLTPGELVIAHRDGTFVFAGAAYPRSHGRRPYTFRFEIAGQRDGGHREIIGTPEVPLWKHVIPKTGLYDTHLAGGGWERKWVELGSLFGDYDAYYEEGGACKYDELINLQFVIGREEISNLLQDTGNSALVKEAAQLLLDAPHETPVATNGITIATLPSAKLN